MADGSQRPEAAPRARRHRLMFIVGAVIVVAFAPFDAYAERGSLAEIWLLRLAWAAGLLAIAWTQPRLSQAAWRWAVAIGAVGSNAAFLWLVILAGGLSSPQAGWLPVMPVVTLVLTWERWQTLAAAGGVTLAGTVALAVRDGTDPVLSGGLVAGAALLAVGLARAFHLVQLEEADLRAERDAAQARLAESEQARQRAERLAAAGRIASATTHAVNSPLAAALSNLRQLAEPGALELPERAEVVADAQAAVEQVARIVGALRVLSQDEWTAAAGGCDVAPTVALAIEAARPQAAGVALRAQVESDLPRLGVSGVLLSQVLLGLVMSACDGPCPPHRVDVSARRHADGVALEVDDDAADRHAVQDARRPPAPAAGGTAGRGVAPPLAGELVKLEGGRLEVAALPEGGTRRSLWLPAARARRAIPGPSPG